MKKLTQFVLIGVLFLTNSIGYAQISTSTGGAANVLANSLTTNTNVGIGNNSPSGKLDVMGNYGVVSLEANSPATANFRTPGNVQLVISTPSTAPYTTSLQAKHATTSFNQSYPIAINPLGGNVGIGTASPTAKLEVAGIVKANEGEFFKYLPDGSSYLDWKDRNIKNRVLNLGTVRDPQENGRLLCFYDHPQSNILNLQKFCFCTNNRR